MYARKKFFVLFLIVLLALVGCAEEEPKATPAPTAGLEASVAPTVAPVEPTAAPTEAVFAATEAPAAEATHDPAHVAVVEEPAAKRLGILRFRDGAGEDGSSLVRAGNFQLLMEGVSGAPEGNHYELWVVDDSFNTLNLGAFVADGAVDTSGGTAENLLGSYNSAFISVEPDGVDDGKIGPVAYNGILPPESLLHIRHVVTAFETNPEGKAFLIGAEEQLLLAIEHTGFMLDELATDNIREAQRHAEHVVNILDGESGANFGDLDGDAVAQNPGDGFGVRAYLEGAKQHAQLAADAEGATAEVQLHAGHDLISSDNTRARLQAAIAEALRIIASDTAAEAQPTAEELARLLDVAYQGQDVDGNGAIAPIEDEGGWQTAYEHALNMGSFEFFAPDAGGSAQQGSAGAAVPTAAAEPTAATEAEAEPAAVSIDMVNFAYEPGDITVAAGTAVTWINKDDGPRHSATAADGSFDTGLLDGGQEATIVLDTPGTYIYYCTLHGSPDGSGMAATITVTE